MIKNIAESDAALRVAFDESATSRQVRLALERRRGEASVLDLMSEPLVGNGHGPMASAINKNVHLLVSQAGEERAMVSAAVPLKLALEMKRRERPFLSVTPQAFLFAGEGFPDRVADFILAHWALERGITAEALELAQRHDGPPFWWIAGSAHLWSGSHKRAFGLFNQIAPPEDENQAETFLFKAAYSAAAVCLLESARAQGAMGGQVSEDQVKTLLSGLLENADPSAEPELTGMIRYNLGLAGLNGPIAESISWFRKALELSPQISVYAEAASASALAGALYRSAMESETDRESKLSEVESLASKALIVYTPGAFPSQWTAAQAQLGQALLDLSEYGTGKRRVDQLSRAVEAFSLSVEALENGDDEPKWADCMMGLCGALTALGASVGGAMGSGFLDQALGLLDDAEPRMAASMDRVQMNRTGAMMVKRMIENSMES